MGVNNKWFVGIGVLLFALHLSCASSIWQKVDLARRQGKPEQAIAFIEHHLSLHSNDARAYFTLGELHAQLGEWEAMLEAFRTCIKADARWQKEVETARESYWRENINTGLRMMKAGDFTGAQQFFTNAAVIYPERALSYRLTGEAAWSARDTLKAETAFQTAIQYDNNDEIAKRYLMRILYSSGKDSAAIQVATLLLKHIPDDTEAVRILAYGYDRLNKIEPALASYQRLMAISNNIEDVLAFAAFQYRIGEYENSIELTRFANAIGADSLSCLRSIAQCQLMLQDFKGLIETANSILTLQPYHIPALQLLQIAYAASGDKKQVKKIAHRIQQLTLNP